MPKTTSSKRKTKTTIKTGGRSQRRSFSRIRLVLFALVFAAVGGIIIHFSFASTPPADIVLGITHEGPITLRKDASGKIHAAKQGVDFEILSNNTLVCGDQSNPDVVTTTALSQAAVDQAVQQATTTGIADQPAVVGATDRVQLDDYTGYYLNSSAVSKAVRVYGAANQNGFAARLSALGRQLCLQVSHQQQRTNVPTPQTKQSTNPSSSTTNAAPTQSNDYSAPKPALHGKSSSAPGKLQSWLSGHLFTKADALSVSVNDYNVQFSDINSARTSRGLNSVSQAACLNSAAQDWAEHEAATSTFADPPEGSTGSYTISYCGGNWTTLGDNSGITGGCSAYSTDNCSQTLFTAFMNSPEHKSNILLNPANKVGIGAYRDGKGNLLVVHIFAQCYSGCGSGGWQSPTGNKWQNLGGLAIGGPASASQNSGNIDVFIRAADSGVRHRWWSPSAGWSAWSNLGGCTSSDPAVIAWNGHEAAFIRGCDNQVYRAGYNSTTGWSGWVSLGGCTNEAPTAAAWPGHEEIFIRGCNNYLYHAWTNDSGNTWSGWNAMGGSQLKYGPGASSWGSGRMDIFYTVNNHAVYHRYYNGSWSGEESLGGFVTSAPGAYSRTGGIIDLWSRGSNGMVYHKWFTTAGGWSSWNATSEYTSSAVRGSARDPGDQNVFTNYNGLLVDTWWTSTSGWVY